MSERRRLTRAIETPAGEAARQAFRIAPEPLPVGVRSGLRQEPRAKVFTWVVENGAAANYRRLGKRLAASGDLYRHKDGHALLQVVPDGTTRLIFKGNQLAPVIVDRIKMVVSKGGKIVSELPTAFHLNAMLRSEKFLRRFRSVDEVTIHPLYRDDFTLAAPGYNDGGPGQRIPSVHLVTPSTTDQVDKPRPFGLQGSEKEKPNGSARRR